MFKMKRFVALLCSLVMTLTVLPQSTFAESGVGSDGGSQIVEDEGSFDSLLGDDAVAGVALSTGSAVEIASDIDAFAETYSVVDNPYTQAPYSGIAKTWTTNDKGEKTIASPATVPLMQTEDINKIYGVRLTVGENDKFDGNMNFQGLDSNPSYFSINIGKEGSGKIIPDDGVIVYTQDTPIFTTKTDGTKITLNIWNTDSLILHKLELLDADDKSITTIDLREGVTAESHTLPRKSEGNGSTGEDMQFNSFDWTTMSAAKPGALIRIKYNVTSANSPYAEFKCNDDWDNVKHTVNGLSNTVGSNYTVDVPVDYLITKGITKINQIYGKGGFEPVSAELISIGEPTSEPSNPGKGDEDDYDVIYDLSADEQFLAATVGSSLGGTKYIEAAGIQPLVVKNADNSRSLHLTGRTGDWNGVNLKFNAEGLNLDSAKEYTYRIEGRIEDPKTIGTKVLKLATKIKGESSYPDVKQADINKTDGKFIIECTEVIDFTTLDYLRIQTYEESPFLSFYIDSILIYASNPSSGGDEEVVPLVKEDFEKSIASYVNWERGSITVSVDTDIYHEGKQSLKVSNRGDGSWRSAAYNATDLLTPGGKYNASVWVYSPLATTFKIGGVVNFVDGSKEEYPKWSDTANIPANEWTKVSVQNVPITDKKFSSYLLSFECLTSGQDYYIDDFVLEQVGGSPEVLPVVPGEEFTLIDFENNDENGFKPREAGGTYAKLAIAKGNAKSGDYSLKITERNNTGHAPLLDATKYVTSGKATKYEFSVWVRIADDSTIEPARLWLSSAITAGGKTDYIQFVGDANKKMVAKKDGWVLLEGTYTFPAKFEKIEIYVETEYTSETSGTIFDYGKASFHIDDVDFKEVTTAAPQWPLDIDSLKEIYPEFMIGNILEPTDILNENAKEMFLEQFNAVTAENAMKPDRLSKIKDTYDFTEADKIVKWANENDIPVVGHTLVWHSQSPAWLNKADSTTPLTRAEAKKNLENYINTVAGHYKGKVISWDVVNEVFTSGGGSASNHWTKNLRMKDVGNDNESSYWYLAYANGAVGDESGADFIYDAFVFARIADPDAVLYYNDFNEELEGKRESIASMVEELNKKWETDARNTGADKAKGRLLIEGIGMQSHHNSGTTPASVEAAIKRYIETGAEISVTEIDITFGDYGNRATPLDELEEATQGQLYAQFFQIYEKYSKNIERVTLWGKDDGASWRGKAHPTLFDRSRNPKLAFEAVVDPETYLIKYPLPKPQTVPKANAVKGTPVLGKDSSVWKTAPEIIVDTKPNVRATVASATAKVRLLWDNSFFYVRAEVTDPVKDASAAEAYMQDSVELFLSETMHKQAVYENGDGQYRITFEGNESFRDENKMKPGFESVAKVTDTGYVVEVKIPFRAITPKANTVVGFDVQINDTPPATGNRQLTVWSDLKAIGYSSTENWGEVKLVNAPVKPVEPDTNNPGTTTPGGSTGGATPAPTDAPAETKTTVTATVEKETASAVVNIPAAELVKAVTASEGTKKTTTLNLVMNVPETAEAVTTVAMTIAAETLEQIKELEVASVTITLGNAQIVLPKALIESITKESDTIRLEISQVTEKTITKQVAALAETGQTYEINLYVSDEKHDGKFGKLVDLSLPYTLKENQDSSKLAAYYVNNKGELEPRSGVYNKETGNFEFSTISFSTYIVKERNVTFDDLGGTEWARSFIETMASKSIIAGRSSTTFDPSANITRAEFATLLVRMLGGLNSTAVATYKDVDADHPYHTAIASLESLDINIAERTPGMFSPSESITREEMFDLIGQVLTIKGYKLSDITVLNDFKDSSDISAYAKENLALLVENSIITGMGDGTLQPKNNLTRAEAATVLFRILGW